jgi:uncharacterized Zn finger protein
MPTMVKRALKNFDKNRPILKCNKCGLWRNITKTDETLFKTLKYYSCINCGTVIKI